MCAGWQADFHHSGCSILWRYVTCLDHAAVCLKLTLVGQHDLFMIFMFSPFTEKNSSTSSFCESERLIQFLLICLSFSISIIYLKLEQAIWWMKERERVDKKAHKYHTVYNVANYHATVLNKLRRFSICCYTGFLSFSCCFPLSLLLINLFNQERI